MDNMKPHIAIAFLLFMFLSCGVIYAQSNVTAKQTLTERQRAITLISAFTAKGDMQKLQQALNTGLDVRLTINECKEVLVHLYAYCGFPRSIMGLNALIATLEEIKAKGINDIIGREATPIPNDTNKYETGRKNLEKLSGRPTTKPTSGYGGFSPEIDRFLKEHLFADIFSRDLLNYADRELTTVSGLIALGGVEPMLGSHMGLAMKQGFTKGQIEEVILLIEKSVSKTDADAARKVLIEISSRN
jgi:alkylhydroperoxidase/carboxymuconolactone decarboxylase family protein YurZ